MSSQQSFSTKSGYKMKPWFPSLSGLSCRLLLPLLVFTFMVGCTGNPLSLLTGGGPNVAANVQAGKTNTQTIGITNNEQAPTVSLRPKARVDSIDQSEKVTNNYTADPWLIVLLILGWLLPSPNEIARGITKLWRRKQH